MVVFYLFSGIYKNWFQEMVVVTQATWPWILSFSFSLFLINLYVLRLFSINDAICLCIWYFQIRSLEKKNKAGKYAKKVKAKARRRMHELSNPLEPDEFADMWKEWFCYPLRTLLKNFFITLCPAGNGWFCCCFLYKLLILFLLE